jgi:carbonic anhydrase
MDMNNIQEILAYNKSFVETKEYEKYTAGKFPTKKMAIITCMDTRLVELLPKAMNLKNGEVKILKTAGAIISQPFGSVMRSVLVAIYELGADEVVVVGHTECGMASLQADTMIGHMLDRGVSKEVINALDNSGINLNNWLRGFNSVDEGVKHTVGVIKNHPLFPQGVPVHGMIIDSSTGQLELVVEGYE